MKKILRYVTGLICLTAMVATGISFPVAGKADSMDLFPGGYLILWHPANYNSYSPAIAYDNLHDEYLVVWENIQPGGAMTFTPDGSAALARS